MRGDLFIDYNKSIILRLHIKFMLISGVSVRGDRLISYYTTTISVRGYRLISYNPTLYKDYVLSIFLYYPFYLNYVYGFCITSYVSELCIWFLYFILCIWTMYMVFVFLVCLWPKINIINNCAKLKSDIGFVISVSNYPYMFLIRPNMWK